FDRSFMDTRFSSMLDIDPVKIGASYEVELADGRVVSTNTILKAWCRYHLWRESGLYTVWEQDVDSRERQGCVSIKGHFVYQGP
ncbi:hypothetical protein Tco_0384321, partial [Tanacetum coccineum]